MIPIEQRDKYTNLSGARVVLRVPCGGYWLTIVGKIVRAPIDGDLIITATNRKFKGRAFTMSRLEMFDRAIKIEVQTRKSLVGKEK